METVQRAWYCVRTKAKHEHIAAANVRRNLNLEVFHPRLRVERTTRRGVVWIVEPVFPCYIFVHCVIEEKVRQLQRTNGVSAVLQFGDRFASVPDQAMQELRECFGEYEGSEQRFSAVDRAGDSGAFAGMHASLLPGMVVGRRIKLLLDVLGGLDMGRDYEAAMKGQVAVTQYRSASGGVAPTIAGLG